MDLNSMLTTDRDPVIRKVSVSSMLTTDLDPVPNGMNMDSVLPENPVPARNRMSMETMLTTDLEPVSNGMNVSSVLPASPVPARNRMGLDSMLTTDVDPIGLLHTNSTSDNTYPSLAQELYIPIPASLPEFSLDSYNLAINQALQAHNRKARYRSAMENFLKSARPPFSSPDKPAE
ncbi:hypothetical protein EYC80_006631 [Monilinia laxa]|uniref:Uncharacterized protein n=1 Tax=Monilinia laxa TaxID=61186 RepID=A0A5N6JSI7_MONLA|nr:hypothetical protein EYC80_006631 [Monilinia laxa]